MIRITVGFKDLSPLPTSGCFHPSSRTNMKVVVILRMIFKDMWCPLIHRIQISMKESKSLCIMNFCENKDCKKFTDILMDRKKKLSQTSKIFRFQNALSLSKKLLASMLQVRPKTKMGENVFDAISDVFP